MAIILPEIHSLEHIQQLQSNPESYRPRQCPGCHYILDWNFDEDRCRIRTGYGPENISRIRRFAIGAIKAISSKGVAETMRDLVMNIRLVFDYLKMSKNTLRGYNLG